MKNKTKKYEISNDYKFFNNKEELLLELMDFEINQSLKGDYITLISVVPTKGLEWNPNLGAITLFYTVPNDDKLRKISGRVVSKSISGKVAEEVTKQTLLIEIESQFNFI